MAVLYSRLNRTTILHSRRPTSISKVRAPEIAAFSSNGENRWIATAGKREHDHDADKFETSPNSKVMK